MFVLAANRFGSVLREDCVGKGGRASSGSPARGAPTCLWTAFPSPRGTVALQVTGARMVRYDGIHKPAVCQLSLPVVTGLGFFDSVHSLPSTRSAFSGPSRQPVIVLISVGTRIQSRVGKSAGVDDKKPAGSIDLVTSELTSTSDKVS